MTLLLGANEGRFAEIETALGVSLNMRRSYDTTVAQAIASHDADGTAGRASCISLSQWPTTTDITSLMNAITHPTWLTYLHEVNVGPKLDAATFRSRIMTLHIAAASNPFVKVAPILTAEPFRSSTYQQWYEPGHYDGVWVDAYRFWRQPGSLPDPKIKGTGQQRTMAWICGAAPSFAAAAGVPVGIPEWGAHPFTTDHSNRPLWLTETIAWLRSIGADFACYFHSQLGESGPWLLDRFHVYTVDPNSAARLTGAADPDSLTAFANEVGVAPTGAGTIARSGSGTLTLAGSVAPRRAFLTGNGTLTRGATNVTANRSLALSGRGTLGIPPPPDLAPPRRSQHRHTRWRSHHRTI